MSWLLHIVLQWLSGCMYLFKLKFFLYIGIGARIVVLYSSSISRFLRNLHTVLHSDCTYLHSQQQCKRGSFSSNPLQDLSFTDFLMIAIQTHVRWSLIGVLICVSLLVMLSIFSFTVWPIICLLCRNVYLHLPHIFWLDCLLFSYWAAWAVCIFWRLIPYWSFHLQIFSHPVDCLHFVSGFLWCAKALILLLF